MALFRRGNIWWISLYHNDKRYRISTNTSDKKKAEEIHAKVLLKLNNTNNTEQTETNPNTKESKLTYETYYKDQYLPYCENRQVFYRFKKYYLQVLPDWFRKLKLYQIGTKEVEMLQSYFLSKYKTISTPNRYLAIFFASIGKAHDWNLITEQRLKAIRKVKLLKGENKRLRYLTTEEIRLLLENCDKHLYPVVLTALYTGMRKGEILNLKWQDLDLKNNLILLDKTKNNERREIPINNALKELFRELLMQRRLDIDYIFYNPETRSRYGDLKRSFASACRKAGINDFHFHDIRHTFASQLVMSGVDLKTVQELLGHKSISMTLRYAHLSQAHKKEAVNVLEYSLRHSLDTIKTQSVKTGT